MNRFRDTRGGIKEVVDLRYHLATIIAIFFALALGILIGAQLAAEGALTEEHARLVDQIEDSVDRVRAENRRLAEQLADTADRLRAERRAVDDLLADLVAGRLGGVRVDLVATDGATDYAERIVRTLKHAGADVAVHPHSNLASTEDTDALTLLLWGDGEVPAGVGEGEGSGRFLGAGARPGRQLWGWPGAGPPPEVTGNWEDVIALDAVDSVGGLRALIDRLETVVDSDWQSAEERAR